MSAKNTDDILRALLDTELKPEKDVHMRRFGVSFRIQALDGKLIAQVRDQASYPVKGGGTTVDNVLFKVLVIQKGCVSPDWTDTALAKFGATAADVIQARLLPGEIDKLADEITALSGYGDDAEQIEEIKN
ncbi:hypothetical protein [Paenibacillus sp. SI8]|uniref:phage tail assembly chaperone n=1 Tax=unclassified Paenibacillus TaxID=185978 RepID=UPI003465A953